MGGTGVAQNDLMDGTDVGQINVVVLGLSVKLYCPTGVQQQKRRNNNKRKQTLLWLAGGTSRLPASTFQVLLAASGVTSALLDFGGSRKTSRFRHFILIHSFQLIDAIPTFQVHVSIALDVGITWNF